MLAIAHYNLGNVELIGYLMRSAIRAAKDLKFEYPKIATSLVKNVLLNDARRAPDHVRHQLAAWRHVRRPCPDRPPSVVGVVRRVPDPS